MPGEGWVVDASVLGAAFFEETQTVAARRFVSREGDLLAPSLLMFEIASIAAKKAWKGMAATDVCERAISEIPDLVKLAEPTTALALLAYELARDHRISVYDATYLALARTTTRVVATLDARLVSRARANGLDGLVAMLPSSG